jgi:thiol:disulfide interchange protein
MTRLPLLHRLLVLVVGTLAALFVATAAPASVRPPSAAPAAKTPAFGGIPGFGQGGLGLATEGTEEPPLYGDSRDEVSVSAKLGRTVALPNSDVPAVVVLDISPKWHVWTDERPLPADLAKDASSIRTAVTVLSQSGGATAHVGFIGWPEVHGALMNIGDGEKKYGVFEGRSVISVPITIAPNAPPGVARVVLQVVFQACDDQTCLGPASVEIPLELTVVAPGTAIASQPLADDFASFPSDAFARIRSGEKAPSLVEFRFFRWQFAVNASSGLGYLLLLVVAAIGGLLLNLTPCVLPVIPLKIMGLSSSAGSRRRCLTLGIAMTFGVVAFWMGLGLAIATVTGFTSTSQLFQDPRITIGVGLVIAVMAIGMCGFFTVGLPQWVYAFNPQHDSHLGSFFFGVMTAVLSTPCTAPLMGAAAAWAATQPPSTTMTVFATIGIGMAAPYLVLSAFPHLVQKMPRTGPASDLIKQVMGLLLLAAAAYFVGAGVAGLVVQAPEPPNTRFWWVVAALGASAGLWMLWRTVRITPSLPRRAFFGGIGVAIAVVSIMVGRLGTVKGPIDWIYYTPDRFAAAQNDGKAILLDFTAEWCANCKSLEALVLNQPEVAGMLSGAHGIVPIKVDLTGRNPDGIAKRDSLGFRSIPLLAIFSPDGTEVFKSEAYTPSQVLEAIELATAAARKRVAAGK